MKMHICTDTSGRINSVVVTDASVYDSLILHSEEREIYGDKADASSERQAQAELNSLIWRVNRKTSRGRKLNCANKSFNPKSNRIWTKVEHVFGMVKNLCGGN